MKISLRNAYALLLLMTASWQGPAVAATAPRKILFIDDTYIASATGASRVVHPLRQHPKNPLLVQDKPWECAKDFAYYPSVCMLANPVLRDPVTNKFRMWYTGYAVPDEKGRQTTLLLYAESDDGLKWNKPNLKLIEWEGSKENNIVMVAPTDGNAKSIRHLDSPTIIFRPEEKDPKNRYRLLICHYTAADVMEGVWLYRSSDGFRWELVKADAVPNAREFNSFFWDDRQQKYIGTVRIRRPVDPRFVGYSESTNFVDWTRAKTIISPSDLNTKYNQPGDDVYGLCSFPYESYYLGFLHTHHKNRKIEIQLMSSQDAQNWHIAGDGAYVLPNGPDGSYDQGMLSTQSGPPIRVGNELWVYIGISPKAHRLLKPGPGQQARVIGLATLRVDGFASMEAPPQGGTVTTKPVAVSGKQLFVNAKANEGELRAELLDESGKPMPGFSAKDCTPLKADAIRTAINWNGKAIPQQGPVRVRFSFKNPGLYSFWWE